MSTYTTPFGDFDTVTGDGALGTEVSRTRDRPPLGSFTFGPAYDGTCFIIKDNLLYYCKPKQPEAWPELYYVEVGPPQFPGVTGLFHGGQPHYFTKNHIWMIQGTGAGVFYPIPTSAKTGAQSARGAVSVTGRGIFHTGPDGIYVYNGAVDTKVTETALEPTFRGETVEGLPGVSSMATSWLWAFKNNLYFGYASSGSTYPNNILVMNLESFRINYYTYNDGAAVEIRTITTDSANNRLIVGDATGYVRVIENTAYTDDSGTSIPWEIQSKELTLQTRKHFPRWVKYDVDAASADSAQGDLLLDAAIHHTHTLTGNRDITRRLVGTGNGARASIRVSGTGPASIYGIEFE